MIWEYLRSDEFTKAAELSGGVCVVPYGCVEKHGAHLPLGSDTIQGRETCIRAAEKEPVVVFPTMYFGEKSGAGEYPGTIIFSQTVRWQIFRETCKEIYRNGFGKILFVNCHGGNSAMIDNFVRAMLEELPQALIFSCNAHDDLGTPAMLRELIEDRENYGYLTDEDRAALQDFIDRKKLTGHACFVETARVYHFMPELVRLDAIRKESGDSLHRFDEFAAHGIRSPLAWMADFPDSYSGSNEYVLNERIARAVTEHAVNTVAERFRFLKQERISEAYHARWIKKQK